MSRHNNGDKALNTTRPASARASQSATRVARVLTATAFCAFVAMSGLAQTASKALPPAAPIPTGIAEAKTAFLSNLCDYNYKECSKVYNRVYAGIQAQGLYKLKSSPSDADLVFEMYYLSRVESGFSTSVIPVLRLVIMDRATHTALWSISEPNSDSIDCVTAVLADLSVLARSGATAGPPQTVPGYRK